MSSHEMETNRLDILPKEEPYVPVHDIGYQVVKREVQSFHPNRVKKVIRNVVLPAHLNPDAPLPLEIDPTVEELADQLTKQQSTVIFNNKNT